MRRLLAAHAAVPALADLALACATSGGASREEVPREEVLDELARTIEERFFDPACNGVDWPAARGRARAVLERDDSPAGLDAAADALLAELGASHTARYTPEDPAYFVSIRSDARAPSRAARRSAGAVLGGSAFLLRDGSLLYLAVQDVLVDGERLEGRGVTPDVEVLFARPYAAGTDPQLERALAVLAAETLREARAGDG